MPEEEYIQEDVSIFMSTELQSAANAIITDPTKFEMCLVDPFPPIIPAPEMGDDSTQVGDGSEDARQIYIYYWQQQGVRLSGKLNQHIAAILLRRALAGPVTTTVVSAGAVWDHAIKVSNIKTDGRSPQFFTMVLPQVGGANFVYADCVVASFTITFPTNGAEPLWEAEIVSSGMHRRASAIVGFEAGLPEDAPDYEYYHGGALTVGLSDGAPQDLAPRFISGSFNWSNAIEWRRGPGEQFLVPGNVRSGAWPNKARYGKRTGSIGLKLTLDDQLKEYDWIIEQTPITSLMLVNKGPIITGANMHEFEVKIPRTQSPIIGGDTEGNLLTISDEFVALKDSVNNSKVQVRVRSNVATLV